MHGTARRPYASSDALWLRLQRVARCCCLRYGTEAAEAHTKYAQALEEVKARRSSKKLLRMPEHRKQSMHSK
eukprot:6203281-Pleurochrysis_carterae.AAC.1